MLLKGHHQFMLWLNASLVANSYVKRQWLIVIWTPQINFHWNLRWNTSFPYQDIRKCVNEMYIGSFLNILKPIVPIKKCVYFMYSELYQGSTNWIMPHCTLLLALPRSTLYWSSPKKYRNYFLLSCTVKPVYNDHLMGYSAAFWSSSRWPRAT